MANPEIELPPLPERFTDVVRLGDGQALTVAARDQQADGDAPVDVVIKVLELSRVRDWKEFERFERECAVLESLDHPGVPRYLEHSRDEARGQYRLVMTRMPGHSLAEDLARGRRRTEAQLLDLLEQLLDVLDYLHGLHPPVVHRDIKPSNVIVGPEGRAALVDFGGVAKVFQPQGASTVVGTFGYMAPEQLHGQVTPACDLYALGATLAALAAGEEANELPRKGLSIDLGAVMGGGRLRSLLEALLRVEPDERPDSVAAVRALRQRLERGDASDPPARAALTIGHDRSALPAPVAESTGTPEVSGERQSVSQMWRTLSVRQRRRGRLYIGTGWVVIAAAVATRAIPLVLIGVLMFLAFPAVLGLLVELSKDDAPSRSSDGSGADR